MLKEMILNNWSIDISGNTQKILFPEYSDYPAWTVKLDDSYGVAIPYDGREDINECFANARIRSMELVLSTGEMKRTILLTSEDVDMKIPFASLCEALVDPGENGEQRKRIADSPLVWWEEWKELLGNKNIDERIYDVLGELCALKCTIEHGEEGEWNGPDGATYDIETDLRFIEVKSSINRGKREVTISSQFQLYPNEKPLDLVLCCFEPAVMSGVSIDSILAEFDLMGYNTALLNQKLEKKGFEKGMSARKKKFILHEMLLYTVDESFPTITPASFIGGVIPQGIIKISYTVDLSGLTPISLL